MHTWSGNWVAGREVVKSYMMPGLPMHLVQELNIGTVLPSDKDKVIGRYHVVVICRSITGLSDNRD